MSIILEEMSLYFTLCHFMSYEMTTKPSVYSI